MSAIPKILHWVWVGPAPLTPMALRCQESWRRHLADFEMLQWSEANSPMDAGYVQMMYAEKKWAFVSDYIRFRALDKFGGLYLDCDVEALRDISPALESGPLVSQSKASEIQSAVLAFPPNHPMIKYILSLYDLQTRPDIAFTSPVAVQTALKTGRFPDVVVRDAALFFPADEGEVLSDEARAVAYTNHLWAESWVPAAGLRKIARRTGVMPMIKSVKRLIRPSN